MATVQRFEDLAVWQKARLLSSKTYHLTIERPISDDFSMKDQIRGYIGSIMDNIAKGFDRSSRLEFINAPSTAKGETG